MKLLALTCLCVDVYSRTGKVYSGGNALNVAVGCSKSDECDVSILGAIGNDEYGKVILSDLSRFRINTKFVHAMSTNTATHIIHTDENGERYFFDDDWNGGAFEKFRLTKDDEEFICTNDVVVTTFNDPNIEQILELRKNNNFKLAVDFQDSRDFAAWENRLGLIDIYFISGDEEVISAIDIWSKKYQTLFIATLGKKGSVVYYKGNSHNCSALTVKEVVDTTGCGDAYLAAFITSYFMNGNIKASMEKGSEAAAEILTHFGGI
jgi:fructoselysine 6-kinase